MSRYLLRGLLLAAAWYGVSAGTAQAQDYCRTEARPDLFYNYYVQGRNCDGSAGVPAQLYVSPRPTPPLVGHTYITYQPLLPQEFLYPHERTYKRWNGPDAGVTTTHVKWSHTGPGWSHFDGLGKHPAPAIFQPYVWGY